MKGSWKNNISGWNHKDSKRKKQTRKHQLRDNGKAIYNIFNSWKKDKNRECSPEVFRNEVEMQIEYTGTRYGNDKPLVNRAEVFYAWATWKTLDSNGDFIIDRISDYSGEIYYKHSFKRVKVYRNENRNTYYGKEQYYEAETGKKLEDFFGLKKHQNITVQDLRKTGKTVELDLTKDIERRKNVKVSEFHTEGEFMYGKPLYNHEWQRFYGDGKRRKYCRNMANRKDRRYIKAWINKHDISEEVKTHACSKSIAWCIN